MLKIEQNLDAYRMAADTLERLREIVREELVLSHGRAWETEGIPDIPGNYLVARREREASVSWHYSAGLDLLSFAGFVNLYEIFISNRRLVERFARLTPDPHALRLRFLELDTILNRLAYARPVSDTDMEMLVGFDRRLRQLGEAPANATQEQTAAAAATERPPAAPATAPTPPVVAAPGAAATAPLQPAQSPTLPPSPPAPTVSPAPPRPARAPEPTPSQTARIEVQAAPQGTRVAAPEPPPPVNLDDALGARDDVGVLGALYREITAAAEGVWNDGAASDLPVWEKVRESAWYRDRFSGLGLRVVSNFYDLLQSARQRMSEGGSRTDVQEFLKEHNFAQVLLDLREVFRPLQKAGSKQR